MSFIVELEKGVWLAPYKGDAAGRTLLKNHATSYTSFKSAKGGLDRARNTPSLKAFTSASISEA